MEGISNAICVHVLPTFFFNYLNFNFNVSSLNLHESLKTGNYFFWSRPSTNNNNNNSNNNERKHINLQYVEFPKVVGPTGLLACLLAVAAVRNIKIPSSALRVHKTLTTTTAK